jgi:hypothetical protein
LEQQRFQLALDLPLEVQREHLFPTEELSISELTQKPCNQLQFETSSQFKKASRSSTDLFMVLALNRELKFLGGND